jgi:hypothetical protein
VTSRLSEKGQERSVCASELSEKSRRTATCPTLLLLRIRRQLMKDEEGVESRLFEGGERCEWVE